MMSDAVRNMMAPKEDRTSFGSPSSGQSWDDPLLYVLIFVIGVVPILAILIRGGVWGPEPTVGLAFCIFSGGALLGRPGGAFLAELRRHIARSSGS